MVEPYLRCLTNSEYLFTKVMPRRAVFAIAANAECAGEHDRHHHLSAVAGLCHFTQYAHAADKAIVHTLPELFLQTLGASFKTISI